MTDSEHETSTHEVASRTPPGEAGTPSSQSHENIPSTDRPAAESEVETEGKPHQIKPDGR